MCVQEWSLSLLLLFLVPLNALSWDVHNDWQCIGPYGNATVEKVIIDRDGTVFACANGWSVLYRSGDRGVSWEPAWGSLFSFATEAAETWLVNEGEILLDDHSLGLFRSTDQGRSWYYHDGFSIEWDANTLSAPLVGGSGSYCISSVFGGAISCNNSGAIAWPTSVDSSPCKNLDCYIWMHPDTLLYLSAEDQGGDGWYYATVDNGNSYSRYAPLGSLYRVDQPGGYTTALSKEASENVRGHDSLDFEGNLLMDTDGRLYGRTRWSFFESPDSGQTWVRTRFPAWNSCSSMVVDNSGYIYAIRDERLVRSHRGAAGWTDISNAIPRGWMHNVAIASDGSWVLAGTSDMEGLFRWDRDTQIWRVIPWFEVFSAPGAATWPRGRIMTSGDTVLVGGHRDSLAWSLDGGATWEASVAPSSVLSARIPWLDSTWTASGTRWTSNNGRWGITCAGSDCRSCTGDHCYSCSDSICYLVSWNSQEARWDTVRVIPKMPDSSSISYTSICVSRNGTIYASRLQSKGYYTANKQRLAHVHQLSLGSTKWEPITRNADNLAFSSLAIDDSSRLYGTTPAGVFTLQARHHSPLQITYPVNGHTMPWINDSVPITVVSSADFDSIHVLGDAKVRCTIRGRDSTCIWYHPGPGVHTLVATGFLGRDVVTSNLVTFSAGYSAVRNDLSIGHSTLPRLRLSARGLHVDTDAEYVLRVTNLLGQLVIQRQGKGKTLVQLPEWAAGILLSELRVGQRVIRHVDQISHW